MIRIVLHPHEVPRFPEGSRMLMPPWSWWRFRVPPHVDVHRCYDDPANIREASLLFEGGDLEIVDPPALHLTTLLPEFEDINSGYGLQRTLMTRGARTECDVVWHAWPGEGWYRMPGNSCRPGDYLIEEVQHRNANREDSTRVNNDMLYPLEWNHPEFQLTVQAPPDTGLHGYLELVMRARSEHMVQTYYSPDLVFINPQDWARIRALAIEDENRREIYRRDIVEPTIPGHPFDTIFGMEVRVTTSLPPGRVIVTSRDQERRSFGETYAQAHDRLAAAARPQAEALGLSPDGLRVVDPRRDRLQGLFQQQPSRWGQPVPLRPNDHVLNPEDHVLDEIDQLVNEQVRPGPVDDYQINRYDKCKQCGHDWHGLDCERCGCINTEWLNPG